jgi:hypothetical protein
MNPAHEMAAETETGSPGAAPRFDHKQTNIPPSKIFNASWQQTARRKARQKVKRKGEFCSEVTWSRSALASLKPWPGCPTARRPSRQPRTPHHSERRVREVMRARIWRAIRRETRSANLIALPSVSFRRNSVHWPDFVTD